MGKLLIVVGNTGIGKTTLTRVVSQQTGYIAGLEDHADHPFQALFKQDHNYAFANQVDYFMSRMEQEHEIRSGDRTGIVDGGLEMDFHIFTRLFHQKKWLSDTQFTLLGRIYRNIRSYLPEPDLVIYLHAEPDVISERYQRRGRPLEIATRADIQLIDEYLKEWLGKSNRGNVISIDVSQDDPSYNLVLPALLKNIYLMIETPCP
jgi:deoxyadenosine/deoxycytidine kinase